MFTATKVTPQGATNDICKYPSIAQQNASSNKILVSSIVKNIITCRFKLLIKGHSCNLPHLAKQVVKLIRSADPSLHILRFKTSAENNTVLDTEENLPHDEEEIKTCVVKSQVIRDRLHFTMKFPSIKTTPALSKRIFLGQKPTKALFKWIKSLVKPFPVFDLGLNLKWGYDSVFHVLYSELKLILEKRIYKIAQKCEAIGKNMNFSGSLETILIILIATNISLMNLRFLAISV